ncbi:MAG: hypothetical protein A2Y12_00775 [Planctomycetes bacterium GWF2_42_9]|nr:MAG: hypothetical protein A2Y12_00775 [Planctomycetes bacterium GWF2_42_9]HAL44763.1 hypothetical protein [Phycisphaerales bacterium]
MVLVLVFSGCESQQKKNQQEIIRLPDLMPKGGPQYTGKMIAGLSIIFFEVDADKFSNIQVLLKGGSQLQTGIDYSENELSFGNGDVSNWPEIESRLTDANVTIAKRVTLFMNEGINEQVEVVAFPQGTSVNYKTGNEAAAAMGLPAGNLVFDFSVKSLIGLKQVCQLNINPIYKTLRKKVDDKKLPAWQYDFESVNLNSQIRPGQFVYIAPEIQSDKEKIQTLPSLGKIFFTNSQKENRIKFCIIVCGLIKD